MERLRTAVGLLESSRELGGSPDILLAMDAVADVLLDSSAVLLAAGNEMFAIVEIEFYVLYAQHRDVFAHASPFQRTFGTWYLHAANPKSSTPNYKGGSYKGLDLVLSPSKELIFSVLIRSLRPVGGSNEEGEGESVEGPSCSVDRILQASGSKSIPELVAKFKDQSSSSSASSSSSSSSASSSPLLLDAFNSNNPVHLKLAVSVNSSTVAAFDSGEGENIKPTVSEENEDSAAKVSSSGQLSSPLDSRSRWYRSLRVGLQPKRNETEYLPFIFRPYRYLHHQFRPNKGKINAILHAIACQESKSKRAVSKVFGSSELGLHASLSSTSSSSFSHPPSSTSGSASCKPSTPGLPLSLCHSSNSPISKDGHAIFSRRQKFHPDIAKALDSAAGMRYMDDFRRGYRSPFTNLLDETKKISQMKLNSTSLCFYFGRILASVKGEMAFHEE